MCESLNGTVRGHESSRHVRIQANKRCRKHIQVAEIVRAEGYLNTTSIFSRF